MKKKFILIVIGILLVIVAIVGIKASRPRTPLSEGHTLKVGAMLILSGEYAPYGERGRYAIELAAKDYNNDPKHQQKVEIIYEYTKGDPKQTVAAYQKLVSIDHVTAIVGPLLQTEMTAIEPLIKKDRTPVFGISLPSPESRGTANPLGLWPDPTLEAQQMAQYVYGQGVRSVAITGTRDSWEQEVCDAFEAEFKSLGGTVSAKQIVLTTDNDLRVDVTKIMATKPDAVFLGTYYKFYPFIKDLKQLGYQGKLYSLEIDTSLAEQAKGVSNGLQFISPSFYTNDFAQQFKTAAGYDPSIPAGQAHDALALLLTLYKQGDSQDDLLKKMEQVKEFDGVSGHITFPNHRAVFPLSLFELQNGIIVPLDTKNR